MFQPRTDRPNPRRRPFSQLVHFFHTRTLLRECSRKFIDEDRSGQTTSANQRALRAWNSDVVADDGE